MDTHLRVFSENFPMNTNMTWFRWFAKNLCILVLWMKVYIFEIKMFIRTQVTILLDVLFDPLMLMQQPNAA